MTLSPRQPDPTDAQEERNGARQDEPRHGQIPRHRGLRGLQRALRRAENGNAGQGGPDRRSEGACDARTSQVPAVDSGGRGREGQDQHTSTVGRGASPVSRASSSPSGWPHPDEFWP